MRATVSCAMAIVFASGCGDTLQPLLSDRPSLSVATGSGNPFLLFLPPVAASPGPGVNVTTLAPRLHVTCTPGDAVCPPGTSLLYTAVLETGHYAVQWSEPKVTGASYRLTVLVGEHRLGHLDYVVQPATPATVPVKFRIEDGALCYEGSVPIPECGMGTLPPSGGSVTIGDLALAALPGFRNQATTFLLQRLHDVPCLATDFAQFEGCYEITVLPPLLDGELFEPNSVWVGFCLDPRVRKDYVEKYKSPGKPWAAGAGIEELYYSNTPPDHPSDAATPDCSGFEANVPSDDDIIAMTLYRLKRGLRGPLAFVFGSELLADDLIRNVSIRDASRFGWVRVLYVAPLTAAAVAGVPAELAVAVRYRASGRSRAAGFGNHHEDPVSSLPVRFRLAPAHGGAALCTDSNGTDAAGIGSCAHTFAQPGSYSIIPTVDGRDYAAFALSVIAAMPAWSVTFLPPVADTSPAPLPEPNSTATGTIVITCSGPGCTFEETPVPFTAGNYEDGEYQVNWKVTGMQDGDRLGFQVQLAAGGAPMPTVPVVVRAGDPKYNVGSNLPIKFRIER